jgi:DNA polymerase III sliding clamp (beta) subunit (PCNA family)
VNFNHKYIADCFQSIDTDSVALSFGGPTKPLVIKGVSDKSFLYLVMPMNK